MSLYLYLLIANVTLSNETLINYRLKDTLVEKWHLGLISTIHEVTKSKPPLQKNYWKVWTINENVVKEVDIKW